MGCVTTKFALLDDEMSLIARLYARTDVGKLGVAPLSSMFQVLPFGPMP